MLQEQFIAGLTISRLEQLCQPEQIERSMHLLFALNHWAKARERLFFVDRQGLYTVKAAILRQAYAVGGISALAYIDGIDGFGAELTFDVAADLAADAVAWRLEESFDFTTPDTYDQIAQKLYLRMTSKTALIPAEVANVSVDSIKTYIRAQLEELETEARATRRPIPWQKLMELCIAPGDILSLQDSRYYELGNWNSWEALDASELRKLDPEGLSLIALHFTSPGAHYVFHLPLRLAEAFLPAERLLALRNMPTASREQGEYYGRAITATESLQLPIADILRELEVDLLAICPRQLGDKEAYVLNQNIRYTAWEMDSNYDEDDELDEEFWQQSCGKRHVSQQPLSDVCPLCAAPILSEAHIARFTHWQTEHTGQDLTFRQAGWLIRRTFHKKQFCLEYPPDYRAAHEKGCGTRYWHLTTLAHFMNVEVLPQKGE